jgi:hypothetical protein
VAEVERPRREGLRGRLKSDALDAERAARLLLQGRAGATPRVGSETRALRALLVAREGAVQARTAALNELRALIVSAPHELREHVGTGSRASLLKACARLRPGRGEGERAALALALRSLALRARQLDSEAHALEVEPQRRVEAIAPKLIAREEVGAISAAWLLVAWSQPARVEARPHSRGSPASLPSRRARARSSASASTAAGTAA